VRRVLCPATPVPQGLWALFLSHTRDSTAPSTEPGASSTESTEFCTGAHTHRRTRPRRRASPLRRGNGRRALVGMSYKGPSLTSDASRSPHSSPLTGGGDAPADPVLVSDPGGLVTWPPRHRPASWPSVVRIFVSDRSRSSRRKCVRRVVCPGRLRPQGFSANIRHILLFPARRPQPAPRAPQNAGSSPQMWASAVETLRRNEQPRRPTRHRRRSRAAPGRGHGARRSGPRPAARRRSSRQAPRSPDIRSR
jgi:hypothetical protein